MPYTDMLKKQFPKPKTDKLKKQFRAQKPTEQALLKGAMESRSLRVSAPATTAHPEPQEQVQLVWHQGMTRSSRNISPALAAARSAKKRERARLETVVVRTLKEGQPRSSDADATNQMPGLRRATTQFELRCPIYAATAASSTNPTIALPPPSTVAKHTQQGQRDTDAALSETPANKPKGCNSTTIWLAGAPASWSPAAAMQVNGSSGDVSKQMRYPRDISMYEKQRLDNIRANEERLVAMGITQDVRLLKHQLSHEEKERRQLMRLQNAAHRKEAQMRAAAEQAAKRGVCAVSTPLHALSTSHHAWHPFAARLHTSLTHLSHVSVCKQRA